MHYIRTRAPKLVRITRISAAALLALALRANAFIAWDEDIDGDLSNAAGAPSVISLMLGNNLVVAESGGGDQDYFTFTIPAGHLMIDFRLSGYETDDFAAFVAIQTGSTWTAGVDTSQMLAYQHFGPGDVGSSILGITPSTPQGPGEYTVWAQQLGLSTLYEFEIIVGVVPEPSVLSLVGLGACMWGLRRIRRSRNFFARSA